VLAHTFGQAISTMFVFFAWILLEPNVIIQDDFDKRKADAPAG
jgi:hypothetical protein